MKICRVAERYCLLAFVKDNRSHRLGVSRLFELLVVLRNGEINIVASYVAKQGVELLIKSTCIVVYDDFIDVGNSAQVESRGG